MFARPTNRHFQLQSQLMQQHQIQIMHNTIHQIDFNSCFALAIVFLFLTTGACGRGAIAHKSPVFRKLSIVDVSVLAETRLVIAYADGTVERTLAPLDVQHFTKIKVNATDLMYKMQTLYAK